MVWQVLAMWTIVIATITWFVRDERRVRYEAAVAKAARYYAHAPKYRHMTAEPVAVPAPAARVGGLSPAQRKVLKGMLK
jgi:O-acetyl-ADP-ribose deacetylase (regulator of RNase III)